MKRIEQRRGKANRKGEDRTTWIIVRHHRSAARTSLMARSRDTSSFKVTLALENRKQAAKVNSDTVIASQIICARSLICPASAACVKKMSATSRSSKLLLSIPIPRFVLICPDAYQSAL
jgi:hypothetical protein